MNSISLKITLFGPVGYETVQSVINNQYCFVVEDAKRVYKSTNFGDSWDSIGYIANSTHTYCCRFSNLQNGWVGGASGQIFKTTNGGTTWINQNTNSTNLGAILSLWFYNEMTGWAVGGNGNLLFTSSGGSTFVSNFENKLINDFRLYQNYPNPFNPSTNIKYQIARNVNSQSSSVKLVVFDILGKEVTTLVNEKHKPGTYEATFNSEGLSSGIYFYSLYADGKIMDTKKMVLLK